MLGSYFIGLISESMRTRSKKVKQIFFISTFINPFVPNAPFLYPLKTLENLNGFLCSQMVEKGALGTNALSQCLIYLWIFFILQLP